MAILVDGNSRVLVQGITGREGGFHAARMLAAGTHVVAGVSPGKGGQTRCDVAGRVPVFDSVAEAVAATRRRRVGDLRAGALRPATRCSRPPTPACASSSASPRASPCAT